MTPYLFCVAWVIVHWVMGMDVVITPDSDGYIHFSNTRTAGYPLFLWLIHGLTSSYNWVPHIQLALLWGSVGYVAHGLPSYLRWPWVLGMGAVSLVMKQCYCLEIMTEPLFITVLLTFAGLMLHRTSLLWISLCVGLLILIRPSAYALLPALAVYTWHQRHAWWQCVLPLAVCIVLGVGAQAYHNGVWSTQSFLGCQLIGKVAFVVQPDMCSQTNLINCVVGSTKPEGTTLMYRMAKYMEPIQQEVDKAPSGPIRYFLAASVYDIIRFKKLADFEKGLQIPPEQHDAFWRNVALDIIVSNPWGYVEDVWMNWQALWFVWDLLPEDQRLLRHEYAMELNKCCPDITFERLEHKARHPIMVYSLRLALGIVLALSLWSIFLTRWWGRSANEHPNNIVLCTLSLAMHGVLLLTALVQAGLPRYVLIFWPYFGLITLLWIGRWYEQRRCTHSVL